MFVLYDTLSQHMSNASFGFDWVFRCSIFKRQRWTCEAVPALRMKSIITLPPLVAVTNTYPPFLLQIIALCSIVILFFNMKTTCSFGRWALCRLVMLIQACGSTSRLMTRFGNKIFSQSGKAQPPPSALLSKVQPRGATVASGSWPRRYR